MSFFFEGASSQKLLHIVFSGERPLRLIVKFRFLLFFRRFHATNGNFGSGKSVPPTIQSTRNSVFEYRWLRTEVSKLLLPTLGVALFRFGHAQKNAFASLVALTLGQIAIGLRSLNFRLPVARDHGDCFLSILRIACHTRLKRKELQTAQQKLSERQRRGIHVKSATGRIRRGEPGATPQDYGNPKTSALKARFISG